MRRDKKTVVDAGRYRHALRIEKNEPYMNERREYVDKWVSKGVVSGNVEPFGGYESKQQDSRRETELVNVTMRSIPDMVDMSADRYRLVWQQRDDANGVSIPMHEKILGIQTFRNVQGRERVWAFVCMVAFQRESS